MTNEFIRSYNKFWHEKRKRSILCYSFSLWSGNICIHISFYKLAIIKNQAAYFFKLYESFYGSSLKTQEFSRNEFLCREGAVEYNLYFVLEGAVRAYYISEEEELTIRFGYTGSVINSIKSFVDQKPSELSLQAIRKTKVLSIPRQKYFDFVYSSEDTMRMHIEIMNDLMISMLEREMDLLTTSPKERYLRVLKRSPAVFQYIPLKYIASYLRMTPETLSRLRKS